MNFVLKFQLLFMTSGFDELGGVDDFTTADMAYVLATHGVLNHEKTEDRSEDIGQRLFQAVMCILT